MMFLLYMAILFTYVMKLELYFKRLAMWCSEKELHLLAWQCSCPALPLELHIPQITQEKSLSLLICKWATLAGYLNLKKGTKYITSIDLFGVFFISYLIFDHGLLNQHICLLSALLLHSDRACKIKVKCISHWHTLLSRTGTHFGF